MSMKPSFFDTLGGNNRVSYDDQDAVSSLSSRIVTMLPQEIQPIVIVCIGTDRSTGDSLGPLVGTKLQELGTKHFHVYGTLDDPIHAVNLVEQLELITSRHKNPFIIGIDACLGRLKSVGSIAVADGPVKPGAGVQKDLPPVGNMHITGIVNVSGFMEFFVLQNTRLSLVMKMATTIAESIHSADQVYARHLLLHSWKWKDDQSRSSSK